jgi:alpha-beta hydrolase superfamily lysophospholipase
VCGAAAIVDTHLTKAHDLEKWENFTRYLRDLRSMDLRGSHHVELVGGDHAVLLLHGLSGSPFEMAPFGRYLHARNFSVSIPYIPGYGAQRRTDDTPTKWED